MSKRPVNPAAGGSVGFIGIGNMGRHMARRLADAGHDIVAYDVNPAACDEARRHGIAIAASPREVADRTAIVLCSLPTPEVLRKVLLGDAGVIGGAEARVVVDLSTIGPAIAMEMGKALAACGKTLVDAPVSGGASGAAAGTLSVMISGPPAAVDAAEPLLKCIGRNLFRVGDTAGQGQLVKLVNNMLFGANLVAALEAVALGVKGGVDPELLLNVINASSGRNFITERRIGPYVLKRDDEVRFATDLLRKDMKLGLASAADLGATLWNFEATERFLAHALDEGLGPRDYTALIELFEQWNGVSVRTDQERESL